MDDIKKKDLPNNEEIEEIEEYDEDDNIVELTDEDGVTTAFEYQATIEMDGDNYVVLMVAEQDEEEAEEDGSVVIMRIEQDENGEDIYVSLEDEDTAQRVFDLFLDYLDEEEEGELDEE